MAQFGRWPVVLLLAGLTVACSGKGSQVHENEAPTEEALHQRAEDLSRKFVLIDTHIDMPYRLTEKMQDVGVGAEADFDYPRAVQGGLDVPFMSIYIPASYQEDGGAAEKADSLIDMVERIVADHPDKFTLVTTAEQARTIHQSGKVGFALGMENGAPIEGEMAKLRHFYDRGIRYITLTHSENNHICDSSYADADDRKWNGLSPFGRELVAEMNRIGMMIDVSHVSDAAFEQIMDLTQVPVVATHSSCRRFTPGWERNMSDEMIRRLAEGGGVIHINFGSTFLRADSREQSSGYWSERRKMMDEHGLDSDHPDVAAFGETYWKENPRIYADVSDVADHIEHVIDLVGVEHVGIGSDYDGVGDSLPTGLKDVSSYPNLIAEMLRRGPQRGQYREDLVREPASRLVRGRGLRGGEGGRLSRYSSPSSSSSSDSTPSPRSHGGSSVAPSTRKWSIQRMTRRE